MPQLTGRVQRLKVSDQAAFLYLFEETLGSTETFVLWPDLSVVSAFDRITASIWISMIRDAVRLDLPIEVSFPNGSAQVTRLDLRFPVGP